MPGQLNSLLNEIRACTHCAPHLPLGPNPVLRASASARLLIVGQAPGTRVHATGIPWNDPSGNRLREWMNISRERFYDESTIAIIPMGFCYPGKGPSGDLPPRPECAALWREKLHRELPEIQLTLLVGSYAQGYYLKDKRKPTLTETVRHWRDYLAEDFLPLPHPSPRNRMWLNANPWFEREVLPELQNTVHALI